MKQILTILILIMVLIGCARQNDLIFHGCDTCTHHTNTSKSKTDTSKISLDTIPASITIVGDSSFSQKLSSPVPVSLGVVIKNKEGNFIKGISVVFSAGQNSGSLDHDTTKTDSLGAVYAVWTLNPKSDMIQQVISTVNDKSTHLSVHFQAILTHDTSYNYTGTLTMDSTNMPGGAFIGYTDTTNAPDPFTIASDSLALSNGIPYPFELDGVIIPRFQPGEHGIGGSAGMSINQIAYPPLHVSYEVSGLNIMEVTTTRTFTNPEPCTVTMYWQLRNGAAYLLETVSSPTKGTFTNGRTGKIVISSTKIVVH